MLTHTEFWVTSKVIFLELCLHCGRPGILLWRLSPIWALASRHILIHQAIWNTAHAHARGRKDNCVIMPLDSENTPAKPVITVDYDLYAHYLEDSDLSEDQKRELLQALWTIICAFVDLGFGIHPVQQAQENCGKSAPNRRPPSEDRGNDVGCLDHKLIAGFVEAANGDARKEPNTNSN